MQKIKMKIQTDMEEQIQSLGEFIGKRFQVQKSKEGFVIPIRGQILLNCKTGMNTILFGPDFKSK